MIGDKGFNLSFPNVYKSDPRHQRITSELIAYVDNLRALGLSVEHAWLIARRVCPYLQYLGIQDDSRTRRVNEGPWAGGLYTTANNRVTKSVP